MDMGCLWKSFPVSPWKFLVCFFFFLVHHGSGLVVALFFQEEEVTAYLPPHLLSPFALIFLQSRIFSNSTRWRVI